MREFLDESSAIWSKKHDDITFDRLQKFWSQLSLQEKRKLLRIDKQALFELARKNLYCSRCNGLLLEGFVEIVKHAKMMQQYGGEAYLTNWHGELEDVNDPLVHPWGGLAATKDGLLTVLDCFINSRSMKALQNVFNSARVREREREFQFPDACGGHGCGWISQGMSNSGRGHGTRESCALHTARLPCDTLVNFWSNQDEETRMSYLQMKEEDFIERLMHRFESKRFCRDCRRNVIREFKELKELKRMRREPRCTSWFCAADTAFQYEISEDTVQADWHHFFTDTVAKYHHFEWALGTSEGKPDILDFEDVGMNGNVQVSGLDLGDLSACFIMLRAWKLDGRYTDFCVKAHAMKGQPCVHRRLVIGDGFIAITKGESIRRFFEIAEEVEEEEDDYALEKDGNEIDGEGPRPQKHAKSPELAREFLLDAATVIFKEQVEKAYREDTAQQNAHSMFVSLSLKLLEERVHVACKEIITLEKQIKLLEEEEKEKREAEERRERKRTKEREKKHRRKEKYKGKDREMDSKHDEPQAVVTTTINDSSPTTLDSGDSVSDQEEIITPDINGDLSSNKVTEENQCPIDEESNVCENNDKFIFEQSKSTRRKLRLKKDSHLNRVSKWYESGVHHDKSDTVFTGYSRFSNGRERAFKTSTRNCDPRINEKYNYSSNRLRDKFDYQSCACSSENGESKPKDVYQMPSNKTMLYRGTNCVLPKGKFSSTTPIKQVWEPVNTRAPAVSNHSEVSQCDKTDSMSNSEEALSNCEDCEDGGRTLSNKLVSNPITSSSSSDNCSSCLSSSSGQNTESSSTSDSEDASPHSQESDDFSNNKCRTSEEFEVVHFPSDESSKAVQISNNSGSFGLTAHPQHQHSLPPMHDQGIQTPLFSSPTFEHHNQGTLPWQAFQNGFMPSHHPNHFIYPSSILGYNFQGPQNSEFCIPLHSKAPPHETNNRVNAVKLMSSGQNKGASRLNDDNSSFSLFHFGGPVAGATGFNVNSVSMKEKSSTCLKEDTPIEEYSLFSGGDRVRFSIF